VPIFHTRLCSNRHFCFRNNKQLRCRQQRISWVWVPSIHFDLETLVVLWGSRVIFCIFGCGSCMWRWNRALVKSWHWEHLPQRLWFNQLTSASFVIAKNRLPCWTSSPSSRPQACSRSWRMPMGTRASRIFSDLFVDLEASTKIPVIAVVFLLDDLFFWINRPWVKPFNGNESNFREANHWRSSMVREVPSESTWKLHMVTCVILIFFGFSNPWPLDSFGPQDNFGSHLGGTTLYLLKFLQNSPHKKDFHPQNMADSRDSPKFLYSNLVYL